MSILKRRAIGLIPLLFASMAVTAVGCAAGTPQTALGEQTGSSTRRGSDDGEEEETPSQTETRRPPASSSTGTTTTPPVTEQPPSISAVTPPSATVGGTQPVDVTLTGTRFANGAKVDVGGTQIPGTVTNPTTLTFQLPAARLATSGTLTLTVLNPGSATPSNALTFTVANPSAVSINTLSPNNALVNSNNPITLNVTGAGFISTSLVKFNGAALQTTFTSATQLTASLPPNALSQTAGRYSVTVENGGGVVSLPSTFEVRNPSAALESLNPRSTTAGAGALALTVDGSGFVQGSTIYANNTPLGTTYVSGNRLRATLSAGYTNSPGTLRITVQNPTPGGGTSSGLTFTVQAATGGTTGTTACTYTCTAYGYSPGECYQGWQCDGATNCLYETASGTCGGGTASNCVYLCSDYGYAPGQCSNGWVCLDSGTYAGCLGQTQSGTCP